MNSGRIVLVTGAAGGIGSLIVDRFLAHDDTVIATDSSQAALDDLVSSRDAGDRLIATPADITSEADLAALAELVRDRAGHLDVLVNAAGHFPIVAFEDMTVQQWRQVIDINLTGTFLLTRTLLPLMRERGWGRIVNFGSGSVFDGTPLQSHYVAAKAGIVGFSRSLAREIGTYGITVNVVTPGLTVTPAVRNSFPAEILAAQRAGRALPRDEEPHDLVGVVAFLASKDSDFVSGQTFNVDGGKHMY